MPRVLVRDARVDAGFVREDRLRLIGDVILDELAHRGTVGPGGNVHADVPLTLDRGHDGGLIRAEPLADVLPATADIGLVHLDDAGEQTVAFEFLERFANAVTQVPRGLVRDFERALHLVRGDTLPRLDHQVERHEPLEEREVRVVEDGPGRRRELVAA